MTLARTWKGIIPSAAESGGRGRHRRRTNHFNISFRKIGFQITACLAERSGVRGRIPSLSLVQLKTCPFSEIKANRVFRGAGGRRWMIGALKQPEATAEDVARLLLRFSLLF